MLCLIAADDLAHEVAQRRSIARGHAGPVTVCGRPVAVKIPYGHSAARPGKGCHICLPHLAHKMAAVWDACRRLDDQYGVNDADGRTVRALELRQ